MKYYVCFYKDGKRLCHCFEQDKKQAEHFAICVSGEVVKGY